MKEALSPATDLYGVGAVLYEMLTGRWPFEDEVMTTPDHRTLADRYPQIHRRQPPRPSYFNAQISPDLEALVLRCLAHRPQQRLPSARELAKMLAHLLPAKDQLWPETLDLKHMMTK
jgi:serine/threonine-protein kinase